MWGDIRGSHIVSWDFTFPMNIVLLEALWPACSTPSSDMLVGWCSYLGSIMIIYLIETSLMPGTRRHMCTVVCMCVPHVVSPGVSPACSPRLPCAEDRPWASLPSAWVGGGQLPPWTRLCGREQALGSLPPCLRQRANLCCSILPTPWAGEKSPTSR